MSANLPSLKTLELYLDRYCKVVYRDGGISAPSKILILWGKLISFDPHFQVWDGSYSRNAGERYQVAINHADVNRIILELGGGAGA